MKASQVGKGSLDKFFAQKIEQRKERRNQLLRSAFRNGIKITFSTTPTRNEVPLAKELRKDV
jgi:hypothetical protein